MDRRCTFAIVIVFHASTKTKFSSLVVNIFICTKIVSNLAIIQQRSRTIVVSRRALIGVNRIIELVSICNDMLNTFFNNEVQLIDYDLLVILDLPGTGSAMY